MTLMPPPKPKREDCSSRNEYLTACVLYERARAERAIEALKYLINGYVQLLEAGRDRIIELGGTCDPVDMMEKGDPHLINAGKAVADIAATEKEAVKSWAK